MAEPMHHEEWIPEDTFGARLALVRQHFGWNVKEAADACGLVDQSWRNWEAGKVPRDVYDVARKIAERTGVDRTWLLVGGPLAGPPTGAIIGRSLSWPLFDGGEQLELALAS